MLLGNKYKCNTHLQWKLLNHQHHERGLHHAWTFVGRAAPSRLVVGSISNSTVISELFLLCCCCSVQPHSQHKTVCIPDVDNYTFKTCKEKSQWFWGLLSTNEEAALLYNENSHLQSLMLDQRPSDFTHEDFPYAASLNLDFQAYSSIRTAGLKIPSQQPCTN